MRVIQRSVVKVVDIAGKEHNVAVLQYDDIGGFTARSALVDQPGRGESAEEAVERLLIMINGNHPKQFESEEPEKQIQVLTWIQQHWRKGTRGNAKRYSSYHLKHVVERAIGEYVSNGELKGAMLKAGFMPTKDSKEYDTNWDFVLQRRLPTS